MKTIPPLVCAALLSTAASSNAAVVFNLTDNTHDGILPDANGEVTIGDAIYVKDTMLNSGSGNFRDLYRLQNTGTESGYNRVVDGTDSSIPNGFDPFITVGDLQTVSFNGGSYHVFAIDTNESGNTPEISLDSFLIWTGTSDPDPLSNTIDGLNMDLNLVYDMDAGMDNTILLDGSGSGMAELLIYVDTSVFDGASASDQVYVWQGFGGYSALFASEAGHEDIAAFVVPEPNTFALGAVGLLMILRRRNRY